MERKRRVMENKVHLWKKSSSLATLWIKQPNLWKKKNTSQIIMISYIFNDIINIFNDIIYDIIIFNDIIHF